MNYSLMSDSQLVGYLSHNETIHLDRLHVELLNRIIKNLHLTEGNVVPEEIEVYPLSKEQYLKDTYGGVLEAIFLYLDNMIIAYSLTQEELIPKTASHFTISNDDAAELVAYWEFKNNGSTS